jgi:hypothetical protein
MVLASFGKVMSVIGPVALASAGLYYIQRGIWPLGRTLNNEWFAASEQMMTSMPRQGSDKPVSKLGLGRTARQSAVCAVPGDSTALNAASALRCLSSTAV